MDVIDMLVELGLMPHTKQKRVPVPDCKPYYEQWLACVDTKDNCCGANKCRFFFQEWRNCDKYSREVRARNAKIPRFVDPASGTYNGLSAK
jgi:hypothetical protein